MQDLVARLSRKRRLRVAGLMSGTSADGVDVAIVDLAGKTVKTLAFDTFPYPSGLRRRIFDLFDPSTGRVDEICRMNFVLGEVFAAAVIRLARKAGIPLKSIDLIGSHGQTIHHLPNGPAGRLGRHRLKTCATGKTSSTLQIGEPSVIAERTGITTVADFRPRDIAAGGQGAPLVPYADFVLFAHRRKSRAVQNIGGIANVTFLPAGGDIGDVLAFDTGPGNMIIDRLAHLASRGRLRYDAAGRLAASGRVNETLLAELMEHPFLRRRPPKSTGREEFGVRFADALYARVIGKGKPGDRMAANAAAMAPGAPGRPPAVMMPADVVATATAFTARSIADAYRRFLPAWPEEVILCGGGVWNRALVSMLREALAPARVMMMGDLGIDPDAKEAISFAILAVATIRGQANNVPSATGAARPVVLGKIVPGR